MSETYEEHYRRLGVSWTAITDNEVIAVCPLHADNKPSLAINLVTGLWFCHAEGRGGNADQFAMALEGASQPLEVPAELIERYHQALIHQPDKLEYLLSTRGISQATVVKFRLGLNDDYVRLTMPVWFNGKIVNLRQHAVFKKKEPKIISFKIGYGKQRLYPTNQIASTLDPILVCEGELKALLALQLGYQAVSPTSGAANWSADWNSSFKDRDVVIVYDADEPGDIGSEKVAASLISIAKSVRVVKLPVKPPLKDLPDYLLLDGGSVEDLNKLIRDTPLWTPSTKPLVREIEIDLKNASLAEHVGSRVAMPVMVAGKDLAPFVIPKKVQYRCNMGTKLCAICPIAQNNGRFLLEVPVKQKEALQLIDIPDRQQNQLLHD